jgi:sulfhydrogenase subunit beta (sulfur reductase)
MNVAAGVLERSRLQCLFDRLQAAGYQCVGPKVHEHTIVYEALHSAAELPFGVRVQQGPGSYRLAPGDGPRCFAWANGPQTLKPYLFAPRETVWRVQRQTDGRLVFAPVLAPVPKLAVIGVRACDLAALRLQDLHFLTPPYRDPSYRARREALCIVAVNCDQPAATCFCVSTGDGPAVESGYDLLLSELDEGFLVRCGGAIGTALCAELDLGVATAAHYAQERKQLAFARSAQQRRLPGRDLRKPLANALEHPHWDEIAARCLGCGNCTQVCPSCFCHSTATVPDLEGTTADCVREWDSCFTAGHGYMHGYQVRPDIRSRYRQWLTHKLSGWHDQYGRSGCVGCGRCIAWCPVGIDLTEAAAALCVSEVHT